MYIIAIALTSHAEDFPYFLIFSIKKTMVTSFADLVLPLPSQASRKLIGDSTTPKDISLGPHHRRSFSDISLGPHHCR